jgi:hypothetical protein
MKFPSSGSVSKHAAERKLTISLVVVSASEGVDNLELGPELVLAALHAGLDELGVVGRKVEVVNDVPEIMMVLALEVRHEFVDVHAVTHKCRAVRELNVANDLVDLYAPGDAASLGRLRLHLIRPALLDTLLDAVRVGKAPSLADIGLAHFLARVAAAGIARLVLGAVT